MATSTFDTTSGQEVTEDVWCDDYLVEYVQESGLFQFMGEDESAPFCIKGDLESKAGDDLIVTIFLRLTGGGVYGDNEMRGNEEQARNFGYKVTTDQIRNAIEVLKHEKTKSRFDLLKIYKSPLKAWSMENYRDQCISDILSGNLDGKTAYASCSEAQKDAFIQANSDRVTFGELVSNYSSGDHDTALATLDATNDTLVPDTVSLQKRRMKRCGYGNTNQRIKPWRTKGGGQFVALAGTLAFRDFENSMETTHQNAGVRGNANPLFEGSDDLKTRGVRVHEEESMPVYADVGDGGTVDVTPVPFLGACAHVTAWKERPHGIMEKWDYDNGAGVGIAEDRASGRVMVGSGSTRQMYGMGLLWVASQPDS